MDLPSPLTRVPSALRFVFVVDASVSMGVGRVAQAGRLCRRVLHEAPEGSSYAVVLMGRAPRVLVPPWTGHDDVAVLEAFLARPAIANGSDLPRALALAHAIAGDVPPDEGARIIVVTDADLPIAIDAAALVTAVATGAAPLTHVVALDSGRAESLDDVAGDHLGWTRAFTDEDDRARAPELTGGIWAAASSGGDVASERGLGVHLVRPIQIDRPRLTMWAPDATALRDDVRTLVVGEDVPEALVSRRVRVGGPGATAHDGDLLDELPALLHEGQGLRVDVALDATARAGRALDDDGARLEGLLWATPLLLDLSRSSATGQSLPALASVNSVADAVDDDTLLRIATLAGAVSRVTSSLALPDWRPPVVDVGVGIHSCGHCCGCTGCIGTGSSCRGGYNRPVVDEEALLKAMLEEDMAACGAGGGAALIVEVSRRELLDVDVVLTPADARDDRCVTERVWARRLDRDLPAVAKAARGFEAHRTHRVEVEPPTPQVP